MPSAFDAFPIVFLGCGALVVVLIVLSIIAAGKRRDRLEAFAQSLGWNWYPGPYGVPSSGGFLSGLFGSSEPEIPLFPIFEGFDPFGRGHSERLRNVIAGPWEGIDWQVLDYQYTTGSGDDESEHYYWVLAARLPLQLPTLSLAPENLGTKLGQMVGFKDIKFELDEFNRAYNVQCDEPKAAYDIVTPQMIEYLMSMEPRSWQIAGPYVVFHEYGTQEPESTMLGMRQIKGFFDRIPNYVRQDAGLRPG